MMTIFSLYWIFFKFGLISFGGGYVLLPLLITELVEKRHLITLEAFGNLISIAQLTPGPIGINAATYIGFTQNGPGGAILASIGLVTPSLLIGTTAVYLLSRWKESAIVKGLLEGVRPASLALLFYACLLFLGMSVFTKPFPMDFAKLLLTGQKVCLPEGFAFSWQGGIIFLISMILLLKTKISTTYLILGAAVAGAIFCR